MSGRTVSPKFTGQLDLRVDFFGVPVTVGHNSVNTRSADFQTRPDPLQACLSPLPRSCGVGNLVGLTRTPSRGPACAHGPATSILRAKRAQTY